MRARAAIFGLGLLAVLGLGAAAGAETKSKVDGEAILKDVSLFPQDFGASMLAARDQIAGRVPGTTGSAKLGEFAWSVPATTRPTIQDVATKYGPASRTEARAPGKPKTSGAVTPPMELVIHWYGTVGLGVPKDENAVADGLAVGGKVVWVVLAAK